MNDTDFSGRNSPQKSFFDVKSFEQILQEKRDIESKLANIEKHKDQVKKNIYLKVKEEYSRKLQEIQENLKQYKDGFLQQIQENHAEAKSVKARLTELKDIMEELNFRKMIGEMGDEEFHKKKTPVAKETEQLEAEDAAIQEEISSLQKIFQDAFPQERLKEPAAPAVQKMSAPTPVRVEPADADDEIEVEAEVAARSMPPADPEEDDDDDDLDEENEVAAVTQPKDDDAFELDDDLGEDDTEDDRSEKFATPASSLAHKAAADDLDDIPEPDAADDFDLDAAEGATGELPYRDLTGNAAENDDDDEVDEELGAEKAGDTGLTDSAASDDDDLGDMFLEDLSAEEGEEDAIGARREPDHEDAQEDVEEENIDVIGELGDEEEFRLGDDDDLEEVAPKPEPSKEKLPKRRPAGLYIIKGPDAGKRFMLTDDRVAMGRNTKNEIQINDPEVSRKHAEVMYKDNKYYFVDNKSVNGSFVNNEKVEDDVVLQHNDEILVGSTTLVFTYSD